VDYALFAGLKLVGVVEAKADRKDISSSIDLQCREYSMGIKEEHMEYVVGSWGEYKAPFLFATNGRVFLKQIEKRSGVWFRDARDDANLPRALQGWIGPQDLLDLLELDIAAANQRLSEFSYDLLRHEAGLSLRPYQIEAIEKTEAAVLGGEHTALLEMAAGTGKTRLAPGMIHRFLKTGRFKRILFLVGPDAGEGMPDVFKDIIIENKLPLEKIYDIKVVDGTEIDRDTKIHVSTVQAMFEHIFINDDSYIPSVTDYDLIIADDAQQVFTSDSETGRGEEPSRTRSNLINKYYAVLDYFDGNKIVLTADSAQHVAENYRKPVFTYSYSRALAEGYIAGDGAPSDKHTR
jgi:type I restriction enzyme R subunit